MNVNYTVVLGQYKGLRAPKLDDRPTQAELDAFMQEARAQHAVMQPVEAPAAQGDTVVIDFAGFLGEEQFEGGTAENYTLELGSGTFIPGFEEQLVGHAAGESVEVNVTFPDDYQPVNLAGKPVVFRCKIHEVQQKQLPELNDDFAKRCYGAESYESLLAVAREALAQQKAKNNLQAVQGALLNQILANSQVTVTPNYVQQNQQRLLRAFAQQLSTQGVDLPTYYQYTGSTEAQLLEQLRPQAESGAKINAILGEIAAVEKLTISDEELDGEIGKIAESYDVTLAELKAGMTENNRNSIRDGMLTAKALELVLASAVTE